MATFTAATFLRIGTVFLTLVVSVRGQSTEEAVTAARQDLRKLYAADFAKHSAEARRALASRLFDEAAAQAGSRICRHALLCEARDLAARAGDLALCLRAAAALTNDADLDHAGQATAVRQALIAPEPWATQRVQALPLLRLCDQTLLAGDPDAARAMLDALEGAARRGGDQSLKGLLSERRSEVAQFLALRNPAIRPLAAEDAGALGRYLCFGLGQWSTGLAQLARSNDPILRGLAQDDIAAPKEPEVRARLAGRWWAAADREVAQRFVWLRARQRAAFWYSQALDGLAGMDRLKGQRCIEDSNQPRPPHAQDPQEPGSNGLLARWRFDEGEGATATDDSGKAHVATLGGGAAWVPGLVGSALWFDGAHAHASVKLNCALPAAGAPQTLAWYQRVDAYPIDHGFNSIALTAKGGRTSVQAGYHSGSPGRIIVWKLGGTILVEAPAPRAKDWHHIAYVFTGSEHQLFIDGDLKASSCKPNPGTQPHDTVEFGRWVGRDPDPFAGQLDEVRIYARALSQAEIRNLLRSNR